MSMRVDLHAKVRTQDGHDAGHIERVILDPGGTWVREYVVDTGGWLGRQVLVPAEEIDAAERGADGLRLRLSKAELERLPTYVPEQYVLPPVGWVPPVGLAGLGFPDGAYAWPAALGGTIPVAPTTPAATTVTTPGTPARSTVQTPSTSVSPAGSLRDDRVVRPDDGNVGISRDAVVLDRNGDDVGVVDEVRVDPATETVMGFTLRVGGVLRTLFGGGEKVEVTRSQIDRVSEGTVQLRLAKEEVERLAHGAAGGARR